MALPQPSVTLDAARGRGPNAVPGGSASAQLLRRPDPWATTSPPRPLTAYMAKAGNARESTYMDPSLSCPYEARSRKWMKRTRAGAALASAPAREPGQRHAAQTRGPAQRSACAWAARARRAAPPRCRRPHSAGRSPPLRAPRRRAASPISISGHIEGLGSRERPAQDAASPVSLPGREDAHLARCCTSETLPRGAARG